MSENAPCPAEPAAKRRKMDEPNTALKSLTAKDFVSKIALFSGDMLSVHVGDQEFHLPKALLCYHSRFFDRAFNGTFKEATEQKIVLAPEHSTDTFELVVQWLYTSNLVLPDNVGEAEKLLASAIQKKVRSDIRDNIMKLRSDNITTYISFLKLADQIALLGPFDDIINEIKKVLKKIPLALHSGHIRSASELPATHSLRTLIAQLCIGDFIHDTLNGQFEKKKFRFGKELDEIEGFASDLTKQYRDVFRSKEGSILEAGSWNFELRDPITKEVLCNYDI